VGKNSAIEWTHHTFNPWWGCLKVSPACKHCYAETFARRVGIDVWGSRAPRRFFADAHWRDPLKWNDEATDAGTRSRVFCASMADVFEARSDLDPWRDKLWTLIDQTPNLDWLLLTKRPQHIGSLVPWGKKWPRNIWLGTTVENQKYADIRIPQLLDHPAICRFLSCEPLLGPLDLSPWVRRKNQLHWVIAGGESGALARPMHPDWARDLRDQCNDHDVAFHFKQWGHWAPLEQGNGHVLRQLTLESSRGGTIVIGRFKKKEAGRILDGRTWDQLPAVAAA
jgi:protein gp37